MKVCRLCNERYHDHVDFCFVDGEVLVAEGAVAAKHEVAGSFDDLDAPPAPMRAASSVAPPVARSTQPQLPFDEEDAPLTAKDQVTVPLPLPKMAPKDAGPEAPAAKDAESPPLGGQETTPFVRPVPASEARTPVPAAKPGTPWTGATQRRGAPAEPPQRVEPQRNYTAIVAGVVVLILLLAGGVGVGALLGVGGTAAMLSGGDAPPVAPVSAAPVPPPPPSPGPVTAPAGAPEPIPSAPAPEPAIAAAPVPQAAPGVVTPAPAPASAPLSQGVLQLSSSPTGAAVKVDGRSYGRTPAKVDLAFGRHSVELKLEGHDAWTGSVDLAVAALDYPTVSLVATQEAAPAPVATERKGKVFLTYSETGATVWVDGALVGELPIIHEITNGPHEFKIKGASGTFTISRTIVLKDQGTTTVFLGE